MILNVCKKCGKAFPYDGHFRCRSCRKQPDRKESDRIYNRRFRDRKSDSFYHSEEWKRLSRYVLKKANYQCAQCGGLATEVHHIVEIKDDWSRRLDVSNLLPLCTSCHNRQRT